MGAEDISVKGRKGYIGVGAPASRGSWSTPLPWMGPEARHSSTPMDWRPGLQALPLRAFLSLGRQLLQAALMGDPGGDAPPGRPCHGASWTQCPHLCCGFQPGVGTEAARDILSLGAGYSCWAMGGGGVEGGRGSVSI